MKINSFTSLIAFGLSSLIAYGFYHFAAYHNLLISIGSFLTSFCMLLFIIGIKLDYRSGINIRIASGLFFIAEFVSNILFSFINFDVAIYIIIYGVLTLIYMLVVYILLRPYRI